MLLFLYFLGLIKHFRGKQVVKFAQPFATGLNKTLVFFFWSNLNKFKMSAVIIAVPLFLWVINARFTGPKVLFFFVS